MHQLDQPQLKVEALFLSIAQLVKGAQHHLQKARQVFFCKELGRAGRALPFIRRNL